MFYLLNRPYFLTLICTLITNMHWYQDISRYAVGSSINMSRDLLFSFFF